MGLDHSKSLNTLISAGNDAFSNLYVAEFLPISDENSLLKNFSDLTCRVTQFSIPELGYSTTTIPFNNVQIVKTLSSSSDTKVLTFSVRLDSNYRILKFLQLILNQKESGFIPNGIPRFTDAFTFNLDINVYSGDLSIYKDKSNTITKESKGLLKSITDSVTGIGVGGYKGIKNSVATFKDSIDTLFHGKVSSETIDSNGNRIFDEVVAYKYRFYNCRLVKIGSFSYSYGSSSPLTTQATIIYDRYEINPREETESLKASN